MSYHCFSYILHCVLCTLFCTHVSSVVYENKCIKVSTAPVKMSMFKQMKVDNVIQGYLIFYVEKMVNRCCVQDYMNVFT